MEGLDAGGATLLARALGPALAGAARARMGRKERRGLSPSGKPTCCSTDIDNVDSTHVKSFFNHLPAKIFIQVMNAKVSSEHVIFYGKYTQI